MLKLIVVVNIYVYEVVVDFVKVELLKLILIMWVEVGCV